MFDYKGGIKFGVGGTSGVTGWKVISVQPVYSLLIFLAIIIVLNGIICVVTISITQKDTRVKIGGPFKPLESISGKMTQVAQEIFPLYLMRKRILRRLPD